MAAELFGSKPLLRSTKDGDTVDAATALAGKVVGIYFSAHWCGPCRHFTPTLVEAYKKIKQTKPFEIVFVSSDKDDQAFEEYYGEMPWLAVDYEHRDIKAALSKKYKVSGIPTLVLVDAQGKTITTGGREVLSEDPTGAEFPWTPKSVFELLGDKLVGPGGAVVDKSALAGKTVGLYFSAHWCGPCRGFTPELVKTYKKIQAAGKPFEIVFVSSDRDEAAFKEYHGEMPWLALPFENRAAKASLSRMFDVEGIPTFVVLDAAGKTITTDARGAVSADPDGADFPWAPKPASDVEQGAGALNERTSVVVFLTTLDAGAKTRIQQALLAAGTAAAAEEAGIGFHWAAEGGITSQIRSLTKQQGNAMILLDIPDNGAFYVYEGDVAQLTQAEIEKFVADYNGKKLVRKQLGRG
eukprot:TRINITY_DN49_c0_g1_i1.p2 TRINITY_DN49_c0_g1~~TRINITY_DN49_c0_g1_i1.p2  ORF type:complete len:428 (-),score=133.42 TRINITY_DN49_c0_g1_i1:57-1286(-)